MLYWAYARGIPHHWHFCDLRNETNNMSPTTSTTQRKLFVADAILTGEHHSDAQAMLVEDDKIVEVGQLEDLRGAGELVDFRGFTIMPGFNDAHVHLTMMVLMGQGIDLSPENTKDKEALKEKLKKGSERGPDHWLRGTRYDHMRTTSGQILHRDELDQWFPDNPVVLGHIGAHWGVANSRALELALIDETTPDPSGGSYGRDDSGRMTGYLSEQAFFDFAYPSLTQKPWVCAQFSEEALTLLEKSAETLLAAGVTSIGDAMVGLDELELLMVARKADRLPLRVNALVTFPHIAEMKRRGISSGFGDEWLRVGGIKIFTDGAVAGRSCAVAQPFEDSEDMGILTIDSSQLTEIIRSCRKAHLSVAIHANGERAIEMALDSIEAAGPPTSPYRDRIEHCSIVTDSIIQKMKALNVVAVPFAGYPLYHGDNLLKWYGQDRLERMFAHRSLLDAGILIAGSSDFPCGPLSPFDGLRSLVSRTSSTGHPVGPSQKISIEEALRIYSEGSAEIEQQHHVKGKLAPGQLADFIVVDCNPLDLDPVHLSEVEVQSAWVGGKVRWQK